MSLRGILGPPRMLVTEATRRLCDAIGTRVGNGAVPAIEWAAVRPVNPIDREIVADYDVHASPICSAIFEPRVTSRIQVAHFVAELMSNDEVWRAWRGKMPVIYDRASFSARRSAIATM